MDPISFYGTLFQLSNSLAEVVNVALRTTAGRKHLNSTLKELPILFSLLEEMKNGVLKTTTSIPMSATLASRACQLDLDNLIECLSQQGLVGTSRAVFSQLQSQLSYNSLQGISINASKEKNKFKTRKKSWRERLHLLNVDALTEAVDSFNNSVLLLRDIAMDLQSREMHSEAQHTLINEMQNIRSLIETSNPNSSSQSTSHNEGISENSVGASQPKTRNSNYTPGSSNYVGAMVYGAPASMGGSSTASDSTLKAGTSTGSIEHAKLKVEKFSTVFNIFVCIPKPLGPNPPLAPDIMFARAKLDTGSDWNMILQKRVARHKIEYLKQRLSRKETLILGDGNTLMSTDSKVTLSWYNTHDAMKSYTTVFYVVDSEREHFDILLGKPFYREHGAPQSKAGTEEFMMMGFLDQVWRPKTQKKKEKQDQIVADKVAKLKRQQSRDQAKKASETPPVATSPAAVQAAPEATATITSEVAVTTGADLSDLQASDGTSKAIESSSNDSPAQDPKQVTAPVEAQTQPNEPSRDLTPILNDTPEGSSLSTSDAIQQIEGPGNKHAATHSIQAAGPMIPTTIYANDIVVEDFAVTSKTPSYSTETSVRSRNYTTATSETRSTGSRAANSGPQEILRTLSLGSLVDLSRASKIATPSGHSSPVLANGSPRLEEALSTLPHGRWQKFKGRSRTS